MTKPSSPVYPASTANDCAQREPRNCCAKVADRAEQPSQHEGCGDCAEALRDDIGHDVTRRKTLNRPEADRDRGVDVGPAEVTARRDNDRHRETKGECDPALTEGAGLRGDHRAAWADRDEDEGAEELGDVATHRRPCSSRHSGLCGRSDGLTARAEILGEVIGQLAPADRLHRLVDVVFDTDELWAHGAGGDFE